ncbi:hypothetical protein PVAP13_6KG214312 [Panicum virgatum]|uniref:Uncharacterized protein n=1 Tax=Panicum virgatum TaxID=38727 RepID=A0A8T0RE94_PANVG|nr:hypothetical protein PVAP13_6KG214312 [Panicum virgatum]
MIVFVSEIWPGGSFTPPKSPRTSCLNPRRPPRATRAEPLPHAAASSTSPSPSRRYRSAPPEARAVARTVAARPPFPPSRAAGRSHGPPVVAAVTANPRLGGCGGGSSASVAGSGGTQSRSALGGVWGVSGPPDSDRLSGGRCLLLWQMRRVLGRRRPCGAVLGGSHGSDAWRRPGGHGWAWGCATNGLLARDDGGRRRPSWPPRSLPYHLYLPAGCERICGRGEVAVQAGGVAAAVVAMAMLGGSMAPVGMARPSCEAHKGVARRPCTLAARLQLAWRRPCSSAARLQ